MKPNAILIALALTAAAGVSADDTPPVFEIPRLEKITIDGNGDDWGDKGFRVDVMAETSMTLRAVGDYYSKFRLGWNDKGLLILMQINDDINIEDASEDRLASKDSIEIVMALDRGSAQRYQLVLSPGLDPKFSELRYKFFDQRQDESLKKTKLVFDAARTKTPAGCMLEMCLPWENLGIRPGEGLETALQVICNDYDGGDERVQSMWYPATGAQNDTLKMHRLKLGGGASKPVRAAAYGAYERFRRTRVNIWTETELIGRTIKVKENGKELARERVIAAPGQGFLSIELPMPSQGHPWAPLTVLLEGDWIATLKLPDIDVLRRDAFQSAEFVFKPFVFSTTAFPRGDFEHPSFVEDLVGSYTVNVTYYDVDYNEVKSAAKPGRYGAVVDVKAENGVTLKRFYTLYRQPEALNWRRANMQVSAELPSQLGVDPAVAKEQSGVIGSFFASRMAESINRDSDCAVLLAGLSELKPGGGKAKQRENPGEKGRQWLFGLKAKTGSIKHNYLLFTPEDYDKDPTKKWPLILFLHGSGERGSDLQKVKVHGPPKIVETRKDFPFIVVSPQCPNNENWLAADLIHLLDEVCAKTRVDPDRIYLTGLSMGGFGTWSLITQYPDRFAAIAPICGAGDPEDVERIKNVPAWIFHGTKDQAVPVQRGRDMFEALKKIGGRVKYTEYPDADHDSWTRTYANEELYKWFMEQKRGQPAQPPAQ